MQRAHLLPSITYGCPDCGGPIQALIPNEGEVFTSTINCPWCDSLHQRITQRGQAPELSPVFSRLQLSPLAKAIHADVVEREIVDAEDLRERLTVASLTRFQEAVRELRRARLVDWGHTSIRRAGSKAPPTPSNIHQVTKWKRRVRQADAGAAA